MLVENNILLRFDIGFVGLCCPGFVDCEIPKGLPDQSVWMRSCMIPPLKTHGRGSRPRPSIYHPGRQNHYRYRHSVTTHSHRMVLPSILTAAGSGTSRAHAQRRRLQKAVAGLL